jgi:hypothetical protein
MFACDARHGALADSTRESYEPPPLGNLAETLVNVAFARVPMS